MLIKFLQNEYNVYFIYLSLIFLLVLNNKINEAIIFFIYSLWYIFITKSKKIRKILY